MSAEALKVLELLEAGNITAEEAERLLKALDEKKFKFKVKIPDMPDMPDIPDVGKEVSQALEKVAAVVPQAVSAAMAQLGNTGETSYSYESPEHASIKVGTGDIIIAAAEDDDAHIIVGGIHHINFDSQHLSAKIGRGDCEFRLPHDIPVAAKIGAGDVEFDSPSFETLELKVGAGDVEGGFSCKDARISVGAGDIELTMEEFAVAAINIGRGDASIGLPNGGTVKLDVSDEAEIELPDEVEIIKDEIVRAKGDTKRRVMVMKIRGEDAAELTLNIGYGNVEVE